MEIPHQQTPTTTTTRNNHNPQPTIHHDTIALTRYAKDLLLGREDPQWDEMATIAPPIACINGSDACHVTGQRGICTQETTKGE